MNRWWSLRTSLVTRVWGRISKTSTRLSPLWKLQDLVRLKIPMQAQLYRTSSTAFLLKINVKLPVKLHLPNQKIFTSLQRKALQFLANMKSRQSQRSKQRRRKLRTSSWSTKINSRSYLSSSTTSMTFTILCTRGTRLLKLSKKDLVVRKL